MGKQEIIAEVKTQSPFGWKSEQSWDELFALAERTGDIISVHTDPRWGGSFELLAKARAMTKKPILAKGIHKKDVDIERALSLGANFVLVVGRVPNAYHAHLLIEPQTLAELAAVPYNLKAVWNSRNLTTGGMKKDSFLEARALFPGWLCQASNIRTIVDVDPGADAILVGTHLQEFAKSLGVI